MLKVRNMLLTGQSMGDVRYGSEADSGLRTPEMAGFGPITDTQTGGDSAARMAACGQTRALAGPAFRKNQGLCEKNLLFSLPAFTYSIG